MKLFFLLFFLTMIKLMTTTKTMMKVLKQNFADFFFISGVGLRVLPPLLAYCTIPG
jgi:hypothetical protein